jgi:hypothetical protein
MLQILLKWFHVVHRDENLNMKRVEWRIFTSQNVQDNIDLCYDEISPKVLATRGELINLPLTFLLHL